MNKFHGVVLTLLGTLSVLGISLAALGCLKNSLTNNCFTHILLTEICIFFLFCKGALHERTIERKFSLFVCIYFILSLIYLFFSKSISIFIVIFLIWISSLQIFSIFLSIIFLRKELPWRRYKRMLPGDMDMFCYHLNISSSTSLFILQFSSISYFFSTHLSYLHFLLSILLIASQVSSSQILLSSITFLSSLFSFKELLISHTVANISLFFSSLLATAFLLTKRYIKWNPPHISMYRRVALH
ncbi:hypothetical protein NEFER03_1792 [Nematocida sp. LUAm3]|nr:hypothetical protein NEFER03_1792 [Nematocida sp. LUAm3]KAI5173901.1 hypothetical protein NEFER02_0368 [Nematocida sp. LUAm2]KAI5177354.1 hypothetical protein NEFER01_0629 [Nematocida sp. LUAm1]